MQSLLENIETGCVEIDLNPIELTLVELLVTNIRTLKNFVLLFVSAIYLIGVGHRVLIFRKSTVWHREVRHR